MPKRLPNHVILAIVSFFKDGHRIQDIAKITGVKVRSVRRWVKRYRDGNCPIPLSTTDTKRPRVKCRTPATNHTTLTIIKGHTDSKPRQPHKQLKAGSPQSGAVSVKGQAQRRIHDFLSYGSGWPTRDGSSPRVLKSSKIRGQYKWNYTPEQRKSAVKAVVDGGLSLCKASLIYGVPRGTLWNAIFPKQSSARSVTVSSSSSASSSSSSSCSSGASRSSPYPLRRHSAPMDSSRSPNNSPYHFRKHLNVRQSVLASSHGKSPLTSRSKGSVTATPTSNSATSTEALQRGKSAKDVGRRKVRGRPRHRGKAEYRGSACCFCGSAEDNTVLLGKMCHMRDLHVHYYCLLFSSGLPQNGEDDEGILGFLEDDIMKEILRGKKLSCSYCLRKGATIGCVEKKCKRTYHFPCGLKYNALCMFTNDYRSYCSQHREYQSGVGVGQIHQCPICLETLVADPKRALWAPCCQRNSWFHKVCLQTLALSAGYFFKCPLCNDREVFMPEMKKQGIYVPEQDASWELEPNAFNELLERPIHCDAAKCACPNGRSADVDGTWWEVLLCSLCGSTGVHVRCGGLPFTAKSWSCSECLSTTGAVSDTPSDTPARSTRHCTRRAREAGEEEVGGDDGSVSPKRIKLEKSKEASPLEAAVRDGDSSSVSPDTVLWKLEELGEEVPLVLQQLKDRVRLAHARMKELRLTEREVVRAAQRISATAVTPGQQPLVDRKASSPFSTTSHTQSTSQPPKLSLFKNQVLHEKGQLTLVGMHHNPAPAAAPAPSPDTDQTDKPPCQTFSLDKAHLLALWRCALPVARIEEVLLILETVFSEREAEVAKAAITRASRQRPSPRTTPSRKHTRATRCIAPTTNTTPWKAWPTTHSPATPQSTSGNPTVLQNKSQDPATPQSSMKQPIVLQSSSQQAATLLSPSQQHATLQSPSQQPATLHSPSQQPATLLSPSQQPATLLSPSQQPATLHSPSQQPAILHSPSQQPATLQNSSQQLAILLSPSQQPATLQSSSQQPATLQSPLQWPATLHSSSQKPPTLQSPSQQPATPPSASQQPTTPSASRQSTTPLSASQQSTTPLSASQQPTALSSASLQAATPSCATQQSETPCSRTFGTQCSESHQFVTPHSESSHPRTPHNDVLQPNTQQDSSPLFIRMNRGLHWSDAMHSETQREVQESCVTATSHVTCVGVSEESSQPRSACRRLLLQPRTSITTRNSKTDNKDSAGCEEDATGDTASDRVGPPSLAITVEDPATTTTTTTTTNNNNNNSNRAAASYTLQMTSTFTASAFPPPPLHHKVDSSPPPRSLNSSRTGLPPSSKKSAPPPNPPRPPYSRPLLPLPSLSPLLDLSLQYTPSSSSSSSSLVASNLLPTLSLRQHLFHPFIQYPPLLLALPRHSSLLPTPPRHASLLPAPPRHPSLLLTPTRHPSLLPAPPRHPSLLPAPTRHPSLLPTPPRHPSPMQPYFSLPSPSLFVFHKFFPPSY
ncbi:proline-rich protein 36-like isoform X2 [Portunus trituberculatus]|uniref:proline-rich protein 36-like isoform X2 n=1 Tax=Portunus trituberculatus TaxID=210409 RepID=UPI001E1D011D|nr:proline-rich protein 36-like isoform X2 [Portunus trituberculatus]